MVKKRKRKQFGWYSCRTMIGKKQLDIFYRITSLMIDFTLKREKSNLDGIWIYRAMNLVVNFVMKKKKERKKGDK